MAFYRASSLFLQSNEDKKSKLIFYKYNFLLSKSGDKLVYLKKYKYFCPTNSMTSINK